MVAASTIPVLVWYPPPMIYAPPIKVYESLRKFTKVYESLQKFMKVYESLRKLTKVYESLRKYHILKKLKKQKQFD